MSSFDRTPRNRCGQVSNNEHATSHHLTRLNVEFADLIATCKTLSVGRNSLLRPKSVSTIWPLGGCVAIVTLSVGRNSLLRPKSVSTIWPLYCKTLIIRVTLFSRGHQPRFIHKTLFSRFVMSSSIFITGIIEIICEGFIFASLCSREFTRK